jgi:hypothetical protein
MSSFLGELLMALTFPAYMGPVFFQCLFICGISNNNASRSDATVPTDTVINPLKMKLVYILFKNSVRTSKRTPHFTITRINLLMLFKEIIAVYSENHAKPIHTKFSITDCQSR